MHVWSARYPVFQAMGELLNRIASAAEDVEIVNDEPGDFSLDPNVLLLGRGGTSGVPVTGCLDILGLVPVHSPDVHPRWQVEDV